MTYIPRLAIGPTRENRELVAHILSERRRLCMDEGFTVLPPRRPRDERGRFRGRGA